MSEIDTKGLVERLLDWRIEGPSKRSFHTQELCSKAATLIQSQAAEIERLTRENGAFETGLVELHRELSAAEADLARAREALVWYADRAGLAGAMTEEGAKARAELSQDNGARAALSSTTGEAE
jgi:hypothetical protein